MLLEINKELVVSTAHVPESTAKLLRYDDCPFAVYITEYSWRIHVSEGALVHEWDDHPEMKSLGKLAQENGCKWLVLDQDGDIYDELPSFNW